MAKYEYYFSHARTALKQYILKNNNDEPSEILLPDYLCETVPNTLKLLKNLKIIFYKINLDLTINWQDIKDKISSKTKYLLVVNYFGFPLDIKKAVKFCKNYKILLVEDNTHGFNGFYEDTKLGNFGDIGISSPRKHLPLKYGGVLYTNTELTFNNNSLYNNTILDKIKFKINHNYLNQKIFLQNIFAKKISKINNHYEKELDISSLDLFSMQIINNQNWNILRNKKYLAFKSWQKFAFKNRLNALLSINAYKNINPWAFPVLLDSEKEVINWLNWSKSKNIISFTWPTLSKDVIKNSDAYTLSKRVLCFSTYKTLNEI